MNETYTAFKVIMQMQYYMIHHFGKSDMQNILFCLPMGVQKCKIYCMIWYFQALLCFYIRIFQTTSNTRCSKLLGKSHFICEMGKKPRRTQEKKVFLQKLSKGATTLKIDKVLQHDHRKIKRRVTINQS